MKKNCKKSKKTYFGAILGPFYPNLGKNEFSWKNELCQFLDIPIIYYLIVPKIRKNYWAIYEENTRLTDIQTDDGVFCSKFLGIICLVHTQNCSRPNLSPSP